MEGPMMTMSLPLVSPPYHPKVAEVMDKVEFGLSPQGLMRGLAHHPRLFGNLMAIGGTIMFRTSLDARLRELAILRTAARTRCEYEWGMHVALFREPCRLADAELASLQHGAPEDSCWTETEGLVLRVVDELHDQSTLSDGTWARVQGQFDPAAIVELMATVGNYHMLAYFLNACRIPLEEGAARFSARTPR
jgi:alkylhydroperoxidase family enzyme